MENKCIIQDLSRYIGRTVTLYTTSGGMSGSGFTGVLVSVECDCVRLITSIGEAPACSLGSSCHHIPTHRRNHRRNPLGSIVVIPMHSIASFVHDAI